MTFINDQAIVGFNRKAIAQALGLDESKKQRNLRSLSDAEILRRLVVLMDAYVQLVRVLPKEYFRKTLMGRSEFHYQSLVVAARENGFYDAEPLNAEKGRADVDWVDSSDPQKVADFGERVKQEYEEWAKSFTQEEMQKRVSGHYGDITMSETLNFALGHIGQHIRTTYKRTRKETGIEPPVKLPAELFEGIASLVEGAILHAPGPA